MSINELQTHYPPIQPYAQHYLNVDPPHQLYIEECGNPKGLPILYIHGGPGAGCSEDSRRFFDPDIYRIILFDQRGAGRSTPAGELPGNDTQSLINDIEAIRELLNIERWILFGGSWGSTLSLVYAQAYPEQVLGLILRGIFLGRAEDLDWLIHTSGAKRIFPDFWQEFISPIPENYQHNIIPFYYDLLTNQDKNIQLQAAQIWSTWEARIASLMPREKLIKEFTKPEISLNCSRIECHYFINNCFLEPNQILHNMKKIQHLPAIIIHGRYDMVCPFDNAWELHQAWPKSELTIVTAGHSASEPAVTDALIRATGKMSQLL